MSLNDTMMISTSGMQAQGERLRTVAENLANAESTAQGPGGTPYQRQLVVFKNELNRQMNVNMVKVSRHVKDTSPYQLKYDPTHPAADASGYVAYPNVNSITEMMDMREARRAYEANLNVIEISKSMLAQTINLLK